MYYDLKVLAICIFGHVYYKQQQNHNLPTIYSNTTLTIILCP